MRRLLLGLCGVGALALAGCTTEVQLTWYREAGTTSESGALEASTDASSGDAQDETVSADASEAGALDGSTECTSNAPCRATECCGHLQGETRNTCLARGSSLLSCPFDDAGLAEPTFVEPPPFVDGGVPDVPPLDAPASDVLRLDALPDLLFPDANVTDVAPDLVRPDAGVDASADAPRDAVDVSTDTGSVGADAGPPTHLCSADGECLAASLGACCFPLPGLPGVCAPPGVSNCSSLIAGLCSNPTHTMCTGAPCANLNSDPLNCGSCGVRCAGASVCTAGLCVTASPSRCPVTMTFPCGTAPQCCVPTMDLSLQCNLSTQATALLCALYGR